jgi:malonyl-CoA/methylmalonyl-CoA synthetase
MTLLDLFDAALRDRSRSIAVNDVTYEDLHAGASRAAGLLAERGVRAGDRVGIYCENRIGFVFAYLATLRLGAVVVPINVLYRAAELEHVLADARVRCVVASEDTRAHLASGTPVLDVRDVEARAADGAAPLAAAERAPEPETIAAILYTSGTTGRSKGAMLTHGNLATTAMHVVTAWRWQETDTLAIALPLFHTHGLSAALNGTLVAGARLLVHARFDASAMLATLRRDDVTMFFGVPTMYVRLLEALAASGEAAPVLRLCVSGSAALAADVHDAFRARFATDILERYGATEFGFALSNRYGGPRVAGSVGVPFPGIRVRIVDPRTRADVDHGSVGELLVAGPNVFAGYWEMPDATAAAFVTGDDGTRWYASGDLALFDAAERVYRIVGRSKELIISGGFNIYPREIEIEIDRHPGVVASAVIGIPDAARGELPIAFIETSHDVDSAALLAVLRERLASFKIPRAVHIVDALPRNAMGKIEKQKLLPLVTRSSSAGERGNDYRSRPSTGSG